ncbi:MAG TPA: GvpL/GvpF family gas vesicle protein [Candidatus Dormibacteraeota bacterium]|nr:GvpL/GvpF family gas vesicle protein [Candidatus Dormibacteraeota bacterium]
MTIDICAVVEWVPRDIAPARALGEGPYVIVAAASERTLEERLATRLSLLRALGPSGCLPVRFGPAVADDDAAVAWLRDRRSDIARALARAAGRVEFDLHLGVDAAAPASIDGDGPGARYLRELAVRHAAPSPDALGRALEACRELPGVAETEVVADAGFIAFLASDPRAFARAARAVEIEGARWSGPWAPFTFAARWLA